MTSACPVPPFAAASDSATTRRSLLRGAALTAGLVATAGLPLGAPSRAFAAPALVRGGRPLLPSGVQAGDVRDGSAVLWSRADRPARLVAEISRDPSFRKARTVSGPVVTAKSDFTGQLPLSGLPSGTDLHYRIRAVDLDDPRRSSEPLTGRLRTAAGDGDDVRFVWSGDIAGQGWGVNPDFGGFRIAPAMLARNADFFLSSGDNVYADGVVKPQVTLPDGRVWNNIVIPEKEQVAQTLDQYRGQFRYNLMADNWREFLAATPILAQWDDHEVLNNWYPGEVLVGRAGYADGTPVDPLVTRARQAFHEYLPVSPISPDRLGRVYRKISYGPLLDVFVLDMRSHKDPNTTNLETEPDGGLLGQEQTDWLLRELGRSRATWKVIANDLPLGLVVPDGPNQEAAANGDPGAPLGREHNIAAVLTGLKRMGIRNHVWLTADVHYTAAHHYSPDRAAYQDFDPFWEFVSGPLNAGAFGPNKLDGTFGPSAEFVAAPPAANTSPADGFQFFGEVEIAADTQQLTVTLRDVEGGALFSKTLDPAAR